MMGDGLKRAFSATAKSADTVSDHEILAAVRKYGSAVTPTIRNIVSQGRPHLKTSSILTRLKRLERQGKVKRARTSYTVLICWQPVDE